MKHPPKPSNPSSKKSKKSSTAQKLEKSCKPEATQKASKPQTAPKTPKPQQKLAKPPTPELTFQSILEKKTAPVAPISSSEELSGISDDSSDQNDYDFNRSGQKSQFNYSNPDYLLQSDINTCFICNLSLSSKFELDSHLYFHQASYIYKCMICGKSFKFKRQLRRHCRDSHLDEELKRFSKRKTDKWLRTYFKSSESEEKLYLAGLSKPNMEFFCNLATLGPSLEEIQKDWASNEFYDDHVFNYEEFYLVED